MADPNQSALIYDLQGLKTALIPAPRIAVVKTEWNDRIIDAMEEGVQEVWEPFVPPTHIVRHRVPGAFELPFACRRIWEASHHPDQPALDAILALGAVIRGGTPHFDYVCQAVTHGISSLNLQLPIPVIFGVLTLDNDLQAWDRLGGRQGHKGKEVAVATLKMVAWNRGFAQKA